jgi:lipoprotein-anchoring transpeptidase ErfK/SrfK
VRSRVALLLALAALTTSALSQVTVSAPNEPGRPAAGGTTVPPQSIAATMVPAALRGEHYSPDAGERRPVPRPRRRGGVYPIARLRGSVALRSARVGYSLHVDLSSRRLELRRGWRTLRRITVAIGTPGSPTPTGRFAITDKLAGSNYGSYYGCCILALSGHQPNLPPGWRGGNRLAIHGTNAPGTIGQAASAGCLRAADADLRVLMRRVKLGTPVFIRR